MRIAVPFRDRGAVVTRTAMNRRAVGVRGQMNVLTLRLLLAFAALPYVALPHMATAQPARDEMRLPVPAACISSPFGPRQMTGPRASPVHTGIDLPASAGTWVMAPATGRIVALRRSGALGLEIDIQHDGYLTRYAHLGAVAPAFATGKRNVAAGERIGRVGRTGVTYGTHLHFELRLDGKPVDGAPYFSIRPCGQRGNPD